MVHSTRYKWDQYHQHLHRDVTALTLTLNVKGPLVAKFRRSDSTRKGLFTLTDSSADPEVGLGTGA